MHSIDIGMQSEIATNHATVLITWIITRLQTVIFIELMLSRVRCLCMCNRIYSSNFYFFFDSKSNLPSYTYTILTHHQTTQYNFSPFSFPLSLFLSLFLPKKMANRVKTKVLSANNSLFSFIAVFFSTFSFFFPNNLILFYLYFCNHRL